MTEQFYDCFVYDESRFTGKVKWLYYPSQMHILLWEIKVSDSSIELQGACLAWETIIGKEGKKTEQNQEKQQSEPKKTIEYIPCLLCFSMRVECRLSVICMVLTRASYVSKDIVCVFACVLHADS